MKTVSETARQVFDFVFWLFAPGGVLLIVLPMLPFLQPYLGPYLEMATQIVGALGIVIAAWKQYVSRKDASIAAAAGQIPGTTVLVDTRVASPGAVHAALSPAPDFAGVKPLA